MRMTEGKREILKSDPLPLLSPVVAAATACLLVVVLVLVTEKQEKGIGNRGKKLRHKN